MPFLLIEISKLRVLDLLRRMVLWKEDYFDWFLAILEILRRRHPEIAVVEFQTSLRQ